MSIPELYAWLSAAPAFAHSPLHFQYLPARGGWSLSLPEEKRKQDILGRRSVDFTLRVSRRFSVTDTDGRLAVVRELNELAAWARGHPPAGFRVRSGGPAFLARSPAGTEDFCLTLEVLSD